MDTEEVPEGPFATEEPPQPEPSILVISNNHYLLPLAHKLKNTEGGGDSVSTTVWKGSYERAWEGLIEKQMWASKKEIHAGNVQKILDSAQSGKSIVVSDVPSLTNGFAGINYENVYAVHKSSHSDGAPSTGNVRLGGWRTPDGHIIFKHMLVYDMGAWTGGLGLPVPGAVTLIDVSKNFEGGAEKLWHAVMTKEALELLEARHFIGLFNVEILLVGGTIQLGQWELGWPQLQTHAFMSALPMSMSHLLLNLIDQVQFQKTFTVALPISVSPWPSNDRAKMRGVSVQGMEIFLNEKLHPNVFFHDVQVDMEARKLTTAGTDGLIGVVHHSSDLFYSAVEKVLAITAVTEVEGIQYRTDIGQAVQPLLSQLEAQFGVTV